MSIEAMKQALDALEHANAGDPRWKGSIRLAKENMRQAIEQAKKQKPVAWWNGRRTAWFDFEVDRPLDECKIPIYTAPPQREWVGLTDKEKAEILESVGYSQLMSVDKFASLVQYATEAKLREKNACGWQSVANPTQYLDGLRGGDAT